MIKVLDGSKVFVLVYCPSDDDIEICEVFASKEQAIKEKRRRNHDYCGGSCFTPDWDFNYDEYEGCDYDHYEVEQYNLIV